MKPENSKQLLALHAIASALVAQVEAIIGSENDGECQHENAVDRSTMGQEPGTRMYCPDCEVEFSKV